MPTLPDFIPDTSQSAPDFIPDPTHSGSSTAPDFIADPAGAAKQFQGAKYVWGGNAPNGTDCSGMVCQIMKQFGVDLPRTAADQFNNPKAQKIDPSNPANLQPGDALYFQNTGGRRGITHTAVYLGNGQYAAMAGQNTGYRQGQIGDALWRNNLAGVRRFIQAPVAPPAPAGNQADVYAVMNALPKPPAGHSVPPNPNVPAAIGGEALGRAIFGNAPTQEQTLLMKYFNTPEDKSAPNLAAQALSRDPKDPQWLPRVQKMNPVVQKLVWQKANEYAQARDVDIAVQPIGPGAPPILKQPSTGKVIGPPQPILPSQALAQVVHGNEGAKVLAGQQGFLPALEKLAYSLPDPQNVGLMLGAGAVGEFAPVLKPVISGIFAGYAGKQAYDKAQAGDVGGAIVDALMGLAAGAQAAKTGPEAFNSAADRAAGNLLGKDLNAPMKPLPNEAIRQDIGTAPKPASVPRQGTPSVADTYEVVNPQGEVIAQTDSPQMVGAALSKGFKIRVVKNGATASARAPLPGVDTAVLDQPSLPAEMPQDVARPTSPATAPEPPSPVPGSLPSSPEVVNRGEPNTTGIAQRVHEARAEAGRQGEVTPGEGVSPQEMVDRGRSLIQQGVDPAEHLAQMEARGPHVSADDIAILRAQHEALGKATDRAYDEFGKDSPQYKAAFDAETQWANRIKPYQTEWHKIGQAQQGQTDLDTGSFTSIAREFTKTAGRDMTPQEAQTAEAHASRVKELESTVSDLQAKLDEQLNKTAVRVVTRNSTTPKGAPTASLKLPSDPAALREHFAKRVENGSLFGTMKSRQSGAVNLNTKPLFTQEEVRAIWNHAKSEYIDKHATYTEMRDGVARDLGLKPEWVDHALASNKATRTITADMYRAMAERRRAVNQAKAFVQAAGTPGYVKAAKTIANFPRMVRVFGHGTVGLTTHAGPNMLRPSAWPVYWNNFFRQFPIFFSKNSAGLHEQMMQSIEAHPDYAMKLQAGLKIDPAVVYDDYQSYAKMLGKLGGVAGEIGERGNRGMDVLKKFRSDYFDQEYAKLPAELKTPEMRKLLATWVNHAAGSGDMGHALGPAARAAMFAPSLEASRWARVIGDPAKTLKTFAEWNSATPEERAMAKLRLKRASEIVGVLAATLLANQGALMATKQKDGINFTDPSKSDWLMYKWNGKTFDPKGGVTGPLKLLAQLAAGAKAGDYGEMSRSAGQYARGKLNPAIGSAVDIAVRKDAVGRPLPFAPAEMKAKAAKNGRNAYTWPEYAASQGPIPASGAFESYFEAMHEQGVDRNNAKAILAGLEAFGAESLGVREGKTPKVVVKQASTPSYKSSMPPEMRRMFSEMKPKTITVKSMMGGSR